MNFAYNGPLTLYPENTKLYNLADQKHNADIL